MENGSVQHVSAKLKGNNKGIGFEGHDDTWLAHQNDFQSVLAALNIEHGDAGKEMSESEKKANLEELSKKSKRRVHYQKFVRGKDTNNYSVEDLGCILGTKSEKVKSSKTPGSPKQEDKGDVETETEVKEDKKFLQGGNYADYFAKKMAEMKAKGKLSSVPTSWTATTTTSSNSEDDSEDVQRIGFSGTSTATESQNIEESITVDKETIKKKKSKKRKKDVEDNEIIEEQQNNIQEPNLENGKTKKKKKDKKQNRDIEIQEEREMEVATVSKKKKSKNSNKEVEVEQNLVNLDAIEQGLNEKKKSKKNKKSKDKELNVDIDNNSAQDPSSVVEEDIKKKKSKKSKKEKVAEVVTAVDEDSGLEQDDTKYKKQKKVKKEKTKEKKTTYSDEEKENRKKRKSETEDEALSPVKKIKAAQGEENRTKFAGFKGSNLLSIPGYGVNES